MNWDANEEVNFRFSVRIAYLWYSKIPLYRNDNEICHAVRRKLCVGGRYVDTFMNNVYLYFNISYKYVITINHWFEIII